jgi:hypothetical protein
VLVALVVHPASITGASAIIAASPRIPFLPVWSDRDKYRRGTIVPQALRGRDFARGPSASCYRGSGQGG